MQILGLHMDGFLLMYTYHLCIAPIGDPYSDFYYCGLILAVFELCINGII